MTGRYPPVHDPRYDSRDRDRSRSPPRFGDRRPSAAYNQPYPSTSRNAPPGPRGRGAPYFDADIKPPLSSGRDRPFRDFDRERRPPRPLSPGRPRSPPRNFRDAPSPRELDATRPRRDSREGPSPDANFNDHPGAFASPGFPHGGFGASRGRGRGRGDFDARDRFRRPTLDDRNPSFRARSPPPRWGGRSNSREGRDEWRGDRADDDRWPPRDRERDARDRDMSWRGSVAGARFDSRSSGEGPSRPQTPSQASQPQTPGLDRGPLFESGRPSIDRRASVSAGARGSDASESVQTSSRPDQPLAPSVPAFGSFTFKPSGVAAPATSNVARPPSQESKQPPSPKPQAAPVPPTTASASDGVAEPATSPVVAVPPAAAEASSQTVIEPQVAQPVNEPVPTAAEPEPIIKGQSPPAEAPVTIPPPQSPKAQRIPTDAPRGPRALQTSPQLPAREIRHARSSSFGSSTTGSLPIPTGPAALRADERRPPPVFPPSSAWSRVPTGPASATSASPSLSTSAWPQQQQATQPQTPRPSADAPSIEQTTPTERKPPTGPAALESKITRPEAVPLGVPTGPRAATGMQQSPSMTSPRIPTAPRADRVPPTGPRVSNDRTSFSSQRPVVTAPRAPPTAPTAPRATWTQRRTSQLRDQQSSVKRDPSVEDKDQVTQAQQSSPIAAAQGAAMSSTSQHQPIADKQKDEGALDEIGDPIEKAIDSSSDDDDDMDLDEADFEARRIRFERTKAKLEAQIVDLSDRAYRMTTPFEQIARIARVTVDDIPSLDELSPEEDAPGLDDEIRSGVASRSTDETDQKLLTPKEEDTEDIEMDVSDTVIKILPRIRRRASPEIINLPYLTKTPLSPTEGLSDLVAQQESVKPVLYEYLQAMQARKLAAERDITQDFAERYRQWKRISRTVADERAERERVDRELSGDPNAENDNVANASEIPINEGSRRLHKFSSEYDIQKVLKESEEMARQQQEKEEKDAQKARDALEKEATVPLLMDEDMIKRSLFRNTNNQRQPSHLIAIFGYDPPADDFTEEEHEIFLHAFKERPKKWGEIAELLPGRTYQNCIHHYYTHKWDGRFRETKRKSRKGMGRGRGGKVATRIRGAALMADLSRPEDDGPTDNGSTATGRPRRAAAVRGSAAPVVPAPQDQEEPKTGASTPARRGGKGEPMPEGGEKTAKRRRGAAGDKPAKRVKSQAAANAAPSASAASTPPAIPVSLPEAAPLKVERDARFKPAEPTKEDLARIDEANLLAGLQAGNRAVRGDTLPVYHTEPFFQPPQVQEPVERSRPSASSGQQRQAASSYWSVPEQTDFLKFLGYYGTDFAAIAAQMGTKTQTMVKNHYQRRIEGDQKEEYLKVAEAANERRQRGEDLGPAPTSTPLVKRRYDNPSLTTSRPTAASADGPEEDAPIGTSRFASAALPTSRGTPGPLPTSLTSAPAKSNVPAPARAPQVSGPRMGFFSESRDARPPQPPFGQQPPPPSRLGPQPIQSQMPQQGPPRSQQSDTKAVGSTWYQNLIQEQERALGLQKEQEARSSQDRVPQVPHADRHPPSERPPTSLGEPQHLKHEERPHPPSGPMYPHRGAPPMRGLAGSPAQAGSVPPALGPGTHQDSSSPVKSMGGFRPSSVPTPPARPATNTAKTSNIMSILNSDPEPPPAAKRLSDHGLQRAQSPASIPRHHTPTGMSSMPRKDTIGSTGPPSRPFYDRPGASTPTQPPAQPKFESVWSGVPSARREEWPPRPVVPPPQSASPGPGALDRDRYYQHRGSNLGPAGVPSRSAASPPPHPHAQSLLGRHSRTSSFSVSAPPPQPGPPGQMPPYQSREYAGPAQGPYGSAPQGPASHLQQGQPAHNSPNPQPISYHSRRTSREDEYARASERWAQSQDRYAAEREAERERGREREREREREAAYAADQARYRGAPQHPQSLQGPPPPQAPSSYGQMREQAPPPSLGPPSGPPLGAYRHDERLPPSGPSAEVNRYEHTYRDQREPPPPSSSSSFYSRERERERDREREAEYAAREQREREYSHRERDEYLRRGVPPPPQAQSAPPPQYGAPVQPPMPPHQQQQQQQMEDDHRRRREEEWAAAREGGYYHRPGSGVGYPPQPPATGGQGGAGRAYRHGHPGAPRR